MNIFILDEDPVVAAQLQCDKHVVKMIVECAQMLSTAHRMLDGEEYRAPYKSGNRIVKKWQLQQNDDIVYSAVHMGHPCTVWTMESSDNYQWHYEHFIALCMEYQYRYGKVHATHQKLGKILSVTPRNIPNIGLTPFKLAMQAEPQCMLEDAVKSYQAYYMTKQERFKMVWSKRSIPDWFHVSANAA